MSTTLTNGLIGRRGLLKKGAVTIAALRTKSISINNEPVDITTDTDAGWRKLLEADPAERSVEITADGILKDNAIIDDVLTDDGASGIYSFEFGTETKTLSGTFRLSNVEIGAPYNEAMTLSLTLQSSGPITHAA